MVRNSARDRSGKAPIARSRPLVDMGARHRAILEMLASPPPERSPAVRSHSSFPDACSGSKSFIIKRLMFGWHILLHENIGNKLLAQSKTGGACHGSVALPSRTDGRRNEMGRPVDPNERAAKWSPGWGMSHARRRHPSIRHTSICGTWPTRHEFRCSIPYGFRRTVAPYYHARRADRCKTEMTWQFR